MDAGDSAFGISFGLELVLKGFACSLIGLLTGFGLSLESCTVFGEDCVEFEENFELKLLIHEPLLPLRPSLDSFWLLMAVGGVAGEGGEAAAASPFSITDSFVCERRSGLGRVA